MQLRSMVADTRPLEHLDFRRLWLANVVTVVGAQLTVVAVPAQLYADTGSSAYVGLTGVFGLVPLVVFGLWGGALADHLDRRRLLLITTVGLIGTSALFWVQAALGMRNVWVLLGLFAVQQAFFAVNQPTRAAMIPSLVPLGLLPAAAALNMTVMMAGAIAGPLIAGALIPVTGLALLYLLDTVTLLATLWAVLRLPPMPVLRDGSDPGLARDPARPVRAPGLRSIVDGLAYLRGHPVLMMSFVVDLIAMIFGMPRALFPEMAHRSFGGSPGGGLAFAVLFAAFPVGAVVGGVLSGWVSRVRHQGQAVVWSVVVWGAAITATGLSVGLADGRATPWLWAAAAALAVGGAADIASASFRTAMLQGAASDAVRGRLQGVFSVVVVGGPRIADTAHGWVAARVGVAPTTFGGGVLVILAVAVAVALAPSFWRYRVPRQGEPVRPPVGG